MKKFNPYNTYLLGKQLSPALALKEEDCKYGDVLWQLYVARNVLSDQTSEPTVFQPASLRAAQSVLEAIDRILPADIQQIFGADQDTKVFAYEIHTVRTAIENLETVLRNDMPGVSCYVVSQKGIYKTDDLITHADHHFPSAIRAEIPEQAKIDLIESGKCLAFEVPTACAFHLWRAVETVMANYYAKLTNSTFKADKIAKNWAAYIRALNEKGAEPNITKFLDHIRSEYRNPQTHPEAMLDVNEALGLFGVALSAIHQMVLEIQKLEKVEDAMATQTPRR
jgi:hypothetical protein